MKPPIPQELIHGILLLLPVKSLCRFRCVSKSFCALIDSPDFVNTQLNTSRENKTKMVFEEVPTSKTRNSKCTAFYVCDIDNGPEEKIIFEDQQRKRFTPRSYCNGLFLLSHGLSNLVLWNPSTKQDRDLPTCPLNRTECGDYYKCRMGLGYDAVGDEYKVVLLVLRAGNLACQVWIFGVGSNVWRKIDYEYFPLGDKGMSHFAYFAHGNIHWLHNSVENFPEQKIVAFDVWKEEFVDVVLPVEPTKGYFTGLHVLDECLCIGYFSYATVKESNLYVRNKDGDDYIWSKLCMITYGMPLLHLDVKHFMDVKVVGYSKDGSKILMDVGLKFMISYDLKEILFDKIDAAGAYEYGQHPIMFTESLESEKIKIGLFL